MSGGKEVMCTHRIKIGDSEQWHYISQQCRDRVSGEGGREGRGGEKRGEEGRRGERRSERGREGRGRGEGTGMSGCGHI